MGQHEKAGSAPAPGRRRPRFFVRWLYLLLILRQFRWTLAALAAAVAIGTLCYRMSPPGKDRDNSWPTSLYGAWMALVAQPLDNPPGNWYLKLMCCAYPVVGFILLGEGVVRLSLLMLSRRRGEKEWMQVMASTCRDHVVLCGLGHLGFRVLEQLLLSGVEVVCIERDRESRLVAQAKSMGVAVLVRDMTEDQALIDAGVKVARAIVAATNDDIANLEVALDSRRINPKIRVILRLFDQHLAAKVSDALTLDAAFSSSSLAAPVVAGLALGAQVISASTVAGVQCLIAEFKAEPNSVLVGRRVADVEGRFKVRVLAITTPAGTADSLPGLDTSITANDKVVVHGAVDRLADLTAACAGRGA
jgi:voltage-gated potassium channel